MIPLPKKLTGLRHLLPIFLFIFILLNCYYIYQLPFFSDDIFNMSEAPHVLNNFTGALQNNLHYARMPLYSLINLTSLKYFGGLSGVVHLIVFFLNIIVFIILLRGTKLQNNFKLGTLIFFLSLPTSASNIIWFTSSHATFCILFSGLSALSFRRYFETNYFRYLIISLFFQIASINTLEIGYVLLVLHFLFVCPTMSMDLPLIKQFSKRILPLAVVTIGNKLLSPVIWGLESSSNHYSFSLSHAIKSLPDLIWWYFSYFDHSPSSMTKTVLTLVLISLPPLLLLSKRTDLKAAGSWLVLGLLISIPYAGITAYNYMYPRFAYPFGIFFTLSLAYLSSFALSKIRNRYRHLLYIPLIFFAVSWTAKVLVPLPKLERYVSSFYMGLKQVDSEIPSNSLVLIFVYRPNKNIIYLFENSEYIEWAHSIIGYSRLAGLENRNIHFIILNHQEDLQNGTFQIKLRGHYGIRFGDGCLGMSNLMEYFGLKNVYQLAYKNNEMAIALSTKTNCDKITNNFRKAIRSNE